MFVFATTLIILSNGDCELLGVNQLDHKPHHLPPSCMKTKNVWSFTYHPPIHLHVVLLRHSDTDVLYLMKYCGSKMFQISS
jgi:hypothetical protein